MGRGGFRLGWGDLVSGVSVAGLLIPESLAYAAIAGLPSVAALIGGIAGGLAYALQGRSRFAVVSPTSSSATLLAAALASLGVASGDRLGAAVTMVGLVAAILLLLALFRMGGLASFVSRPVLRGFALGLALTIIIKQLPLIAGVDVPRGPIGPTLVALVRAAPGFHPWCIALGGLSLAALLLARRIPRLPGAIAILVGGVILSSLVDLPALGIRSAGPVAFALPHLHVPQLGFDQFAQLVQLAAPIALILFAESWGTVRSMALRHGDLINADRELAAIGAANACSAMLGGMPVGAGFSVGSASESAGAGSRFAALTAALVLLLLALFAGNWLARIPEPMLAAVVIAALTHALSPEPFRKLFAIGRDQWIALFAAGAVLLLGVLNGMLVAVALSIASLLRHFSQPPISELGRTGEDGHDFVDRVAHPEAAEVPGVVAYRPNAPLFFANADASLGRIADLASAGEARAVVLSLEYTYDLDSSALESFGEFESQLDKHGKRLFLARVHDNVRAALLAAGHERVARNATFSVADAVEEAVTAMGAPR